MKKCLLTLVCFFLVSGFAFAKKESIGFDDSDYFPNHSKFPANIKLGYTQLGMNEWEEDKIYSGIDFEVRLADNFEPGFFHGMVLGYKGLFAEDEDLMSQISMGIVSGVRFGGETRTILYMEFSIPVQFVTSFNHPLMEGDDRNASICFSPGFSLGYQNYSIEFHYNHYMGRINEMSGYTFATSYRF